MMDIALTTVSSKGQVVIPSEMRDGLKAGDRLLVIKQGHQLILEKTTVLDKQLAEDLEFARRTEAAWKRYERGEFKCMDFDEFIEEMKTW